MKLRTRTIGAISATVLTTGLVLGLTFGANSAQSSTTPTPATVSMPMDQMSSMGSMMTGDSNAMAGMMDSSNMSAMHTMMHQMMKGTVDDEVLAACDSAHTTMAGSMATTPAAGQTQHDAHHKGTES